MTPPAIDAFTAFNGCNGSGALNAFDEVDAWKLFDQVEASFEQQQGKEEEQGAHGDGNAPCGACTSSDKEMIHADMPGQKGNNKGKKYGGRGRSTNNNTYVGTLPAHGFDRHQKQHHQAHVPPPLNAMEDEEERCVHCGSADIVMEGGCLVCNRCLTLHHRRLDNAPEWRYYGSEDNRAQNPTRCGPPSSELIPTMGTSLCNGIGGGGGGSTRMLQKYHMWNSLTHRERSLYGVFDTLTVNAANNGIPSCILEEAKSLYKRVSDTRISRGENRNAIIACSIYMSCKTNNVPRSIKEIATIFNIRTSAMTKGCKLFQEVMKTNVMSSRPADFIPRFCSKLQLGKDIVVLTDHVIRVADDICIVTESTPPSLVASVIYLSCTVLGKQISKKDIAAACQISHVTISKCYKKLAAHLDELLPCSPPDGDKNEDQADEQDDATSCAPSICCGRCSQEQREQIEEWIATRLQNTYIM